MPPLPTGARPQGGSTRGDFPSVLPIHPLPAPAGHVGAEVEVRASRGARAEAARLGPSRKEVEWTGPELACSSPGLSARRVLEEALRGPRRMGPKRRLLWAAAALLWGFLLGETAAQEGIIHASGNGIPLQSKDYCMLYNPYWTTLPTTIENSTSYSLENLTMPLCNLSDIPSTGIKNKVVAVSWGTCDFLEKARIAQKGGAKALLVANGSLHSPPLGNKSEFQDVKILIAFMSKRDLRDMQQTLGTNISANLYSPPWPKFDYTMIVIFIIAVSCVALGGYWSGISELEDMKAVTNTEERETKKKEDSLTFTPLTVIMFVAGCCVIMILLYFFYKWLVYVMISIFCLASSMSLYNCLAPLIRKIPCGQCRIVCGSKSFEVRLLFLAAFCISLAVVWAVFRNDDRWAWILQDLLGMAFCLNLIKTLKLPNFKACVILLVLLLIYDVFFVFITPFITKNGESIMIEVAAGPFGSNEKNGGNLVEATAQPSAPHEKLPVVIKVPRLINFSAMSACLAPVSILGFGDIIVPGLLVAYCRRFDIHVGSSIYYVSCVIAYAVGMVLTFIVLMLMKQGQPALLYLVPCTLITVMMVAWRRKEVKKIWKGTSYQMMENLDYGASEENVTTNQQTVGQQY